MLVDDELGLYVVCDGMGGHAGGEVASFTAVETVTDRIRKGTKLLEQARAGHADGVGLVKLVEGAVADACAAVYNQAKANPRYSGMGCTLTLLLVTGTRAMMAHVGDTRLYLYRDNAVEQLSTDHTFVRDLVKSGVVTSETAKDSQYAHVLTRAVGLQESVEVDTLALDVHPDDTFLLCSDGLHDYLEGLGELVPYLANDDSLGTPRRLVDLANERGGADNVTALVVRMQASDAEQKAGLSLTGDAARRLDVLRSVKLLAGIPFADLLRLNNIAEERAYASGDAVVKAGDIGEGLYVVLDGRFAIEAFDVRLATLDVGQHVGLTMLLVKRECRATLRAVSEGRLLVIASAHFQELVAQRPPLGVLLVGELAKLLSIELTGVRERLSDSLPDTELAALGPGSCF